MTCSVGLLAPGAMGAALGVQLLAAGHRVAWASSGRSAATRARAEAAGLQDTGTVADLCALVDVVLSVCPPSEALDVAREVAGFRGHFVDANAVSPRLTREIAGTLARHGAVVTDGALVGGPPTRARGPRLFVSGPETGPVGDLFAGTTVDVADLGPEIGTASALKMCYAAYTKGQAALLVAIAGVAADEGVDDALRAEWARSQPGLVTRVDDAHAAAEEKGWRWAFEMEQVAETFAGHGWPAGFHQAAAEVFARPTGTERRLPRADGATSAEPIEPADPTELGAGTRVDRAPGPDLT